MHMIQMTVQYERTHPSLVIPELNSVVITTAHKERLGTSLVVAMGLEIGVMRFDDGSDQEA